MPAETLPFPKRLRNLFGVSNINVLGGPAVSLEKGNRC